MFPTLRKNVHLHDLVRHRHATNECATSGTTLYTNDFRSIRGMILSFLKSLSLPMDHTSMYNLLKDSSNLRLIRRNLNQETKRRLRLLLPNRVTRQRPRRGAIRLNV